jgi:hypothetical protein
MGIGYFRCDAGCHTDVVHDDFCLGKDIREALQLLGGQMWHDGIYSRGKIRRDDKFLELRMLLVGKWRSEEY